MFRCIHDWVLVLGLGTGLLGCGLAGGPGDPGERRGTSVSSSSSALAGAAAEPGLWALSTENPPADSALPAGGLAYCRAKFGEHPAAFDGCERYAVESYRKLKPAFRRAGFDSMTIESKRLEGCMRRHDGLLGVDWMLVEHCFSRGLP
jgi:hypothetical protein